MDIHHFLSGVLCYSLVTFRPSWRRCEGGVQRTAAATGLDHLNPPPRRTDRNKVTPEIDYAAERAIVEKIIREPNTQRVMKHFKRLWLQTISGLSD